MKRFFACAALVALTGCCSYSHLGFNPSKTPVDGRTPLATYEVINVSYKLFGVLPLSTGLTWKQGPYSPEVGSAEAFADDCTLDDNLASVRHACSVVGSDHIANVTGRVDDYWAWSFCTIRKRVIKTSCLIVK